MRGLSSFVLISGLFLSIAGFPAHAQERGGTLSAIIQPEPPILMVGINQQGPTQTVAGKIYQSLLTYDFQLKPQTQSSPRVGAFPMTVLPILSSCKRMCGGTMANLLPLKMSCSAAWCFCLRRIRELA